MITDSGTQNKMNTASLPEFIGFRGIEQVGFIRFTRIFAGLNKTYAFESQIHVPSEISFCFFYSD